MSTQQDLNVLRTPLQKCSTRAEDPVSGWFRDGFCRSDPKDYGKHTVAGILTPAFLEFSKSRGNDLSTPRPGFPGLTGGCRWCLCVERWKEAFTARTEYGDKIVPLVDLTATHADALNHVPLSDFKMFSSEHRPPPQR
ncbi:Protein of unknown function DUF2237 [Phaffia rhodozyma]|uniref:DUF2237 domain-containing protein n=1 Tax=Phaffia rhodozyma TaxID=264483 RepID=A0A0F7SVU9_PHARH|nr:Protein of unknown function DUF2237 [Phaffia rhodozyma]